MIERGSSAKRRVERAGHHEPENGDCGEHRESKRDHSNDRSRLLLESTHASEGLEKRCGGLVAAGRVGDQGAIDDLNEPRVDRDGGRPVAPDVRGAISSTFAPSTGYCRSQVIQQDAKLGTSLLGDAAAPASTSGAI